MVALVQLETAVRSASKMICEPTAEGCAGQETFHHFLSHTPRPITSDTSLSQTEKKKLTSLLSMISHDIHMLCGHMLACFLSLTLL